MKFVIKRTSDQDHSKRPCKGAVKEQVIHTFNFTWKTIDEAKKHNPDGYFFGPGKFNHRETVLGVAHDSMVYAWTINIENIEELHEFWKKNGRLVICDGEYNFPEIEIYDNYRE